MFATKLTNHEIVSRVHPQELGESYELKVSDIICGARGCGKAFKHPGNVRLRVAAEIRLSSYCQAQNKKEKTAILQDIVKDLRESGGRFVTFHHGVWHEVGDQQAQNKGKLSLLERPFVLEVMRYFSFPAAAIFCTTY
jgi:hypothetical protein